MPRLTTFLLRHKLAVVAAWLVVLVAGGAAAGAVPGRLSQEFSFPGQEGYEANVAILETYGTGGPGNPLVPVVTLPEGTTVDSRLVVEGGRTVYGLVWGPFQGPEGADPALAGTLADGLRRALPPGTGVQVTGLDALRTAAAEEPAGTGVLVETLAGGLGALVVLAFVFGSFLALVPLLIAAVAILTTFLAALTLLPVILATVGPRLDWPAGPLTGWRRPGRQRRPPPIEVLVPAGTDSSRAAARLDAVDGVQ